MKLIKYLLAVVVTFSFSSRKMAAQDYVPTYHSHNFYFHVEMNCGNIYPFAAWSILSGALNSALKYNLFESGFAYDLYTGKDVKTKYNSPIAFSAVDLFNHVQPGIKLGYYSDYISSDFNWGILATGGYKINQFRLLDGQDYVGQCIHRVQVGAMALLAFGRNGGSTQALLEIGGRYNIASKYDGGDIHGTKALNNGFSSHFALKFGGSGWLQNIGVYADIDHYNLYKNSLVDGGLNPYVNTNLKNITIGFCVTVTPSQADRRRDY